MYLILTPVPKTALYMKREKTVSLSHSAELRGQVVSLMEKEQESSSLKGAGENELGFIGLHLIWHTEIATRCELALL